MLSAYHCRGWRRLHRPAEADDRVRRKLHRHQRRARGRITKDSMFDLHALDCEKGGVLVTVVAQDASTGQVLMVAFASREALERTLASGEMHYQSRSRGLWHKGGTSGNTQRVVTLSVDCDGDAVLARVIPAGPACHTSAVTCFGDRGADTLAELDATIDERAGGGRTGSYTA